MYQKKCLATFIQRPSLFFLLFFSLNAHASFIESTIGTAVVNDATATFYNPAALLLLKNPQLITLGSFATLNTEFNGQFTPTASGITQTGSSTNRTQYFLPSLYLAIPTTDKITLGVAALANSFNNNVDEGSVLRYAQSSNSTQSIDIVPAIGIKITDSFSIGANINISEAKLILRPISGIPSLNIPDSQSHNEASGKGIGGDVGLLLKPTPSTVIGLNYHSVIKYNLSGKSIFESNPRVVSNDYSYHFWTPASAAFSINHFVTPSFGLMTTIRRIEWSVFKNIRIQGIANNIGGIPSITNASVPYHYHDTWLLTVGGQYRFIPEWVTRIAASYNQAQANDHYRISIGNGLTLGMSMGYTINKNLTLDGSYAHAFIKNQGVHISSNRYLIEGVNKAARDGVSLKLLINFD